MARGQGRSSVLVTLAANMGSMRVVVIGSGIVGAGAAYHLSRRGVAVTVVDGGFPGEATQAGAGIVHDSVPETEWQETPNKARAVLRAAELVQLGLDAAG